MPAATTDTVLHHEHLIGGDAWSCVVKRGRRIELQDPSGSGNCAMLCFHARDPLERYNMPDTLKGQHTAHLTVGNCLYSDMGRSLVSIVADQRGWHDPLGACSTAASVAGKYGVRTYQEHRNERSRNTQDNLLVELGKHGLGPRDWHAPVNWFSRISVHDVDSREGRMRFDGGGRAGDRVVFRADLDVLLLFSATAHPLAPHGDGRDLPVDVRIHVPTTDDDDVCRTHCEQNARALALTDQTVALAY